MQMLAYTNSRQGKLSYYLEGKALSDPETWAPNIDTVRAAIKYLMATGRLKTETEQATNILQQ